MDEELKKEIRKMALQNAFEHEGETRDKIILGNLLMQKILELLMNKYLPLTHLKNNKS